MARRLLLLVAAVAALSGSAPAVAVVSGEQRLLVVRVTWGPRPFTSEQVQSSVDEVDAFFRAASFGRVLFKGTITPWLRAYSNPPGCDRPTIAFGGDDAAHAAGYDPSAYDEIAYLFPETECSWTGARWGKRILLNGTLTLTNTAHELGHAFGLPHAHAWSCVPRPCGIVNLGDPYDTMGSGTGDFNSYEKWLLGWITRVTFVSRPGTYRIEPVEDPSRQHQGFVVTTARNRYWFEVRRKPARDEQGGVLSPGGLLVHVGPSPTEGTARPRYGVLSNVLLMDPVGRGSPRLRQGDRFGEREAFKILVLGRAGSAVRLRFAWTDTRAPRKPTILSPRSQLGRGAELAVAWRDSFELGSGIAHYSVTLDDGPSVLIRQNSYPDLNTIRFGHVSRGAHAVAIVAVDRAGNRSRPATRRFVVAGS